MSKTNCTKKRSARNTTNKQTQEIQQRMSCKTQQPKNKLNFTDAELNTTLLTLDFISMLQHDKFTGTPIYRGIHRVRNDDGYSNDASTLLANVTILNGTKFTNLSGLLFTILCDIFRKLCKRNSLKSKIKFIMVIIGIISCISE